MIMMSSRNGTKLTVLLVALCSSTLAVAAVNVGLEVVASSQPASLVASSQPASLKVISNDSPCADDSSHGKSCIEVAHGSHPFMYFRLKGGCRATGYKLTRFRIAEKNKDWPTRDNPLNQDIADDFCADENSGYVDFNAHQCKDDRKDHTLKLRNHNRKAADVFYEITAEKCLSPDRGKKIYLDPVIRNKG
jgi:hypothetical protein